MTLVIDASAVAAWLLPDAVGYDLAALASRHDIFTAPWLLWAEFRNILIVTERRGRLPLGMADQLIEAVDALGIVLDQTPSNAAVLALSRKHRLSVYDALYLELALRGGHDLATLDAKLADAAREEGLSVAR